MLYNMGRGYHVGQESETKTLQQIMLDDDYEIIYEPIGEQDIVVGKKDNIVIGIARNFENLNDAQISY